MEGAGGKIECKRRVEVSEPCEDDEQQRQQHHSAKHSHDPVNLHDAAIEKDEGNQAGTHSQQCLFAHDDRHTHNTHRVKRPSCIGQKKAQILGEADAAGSNRERCAEQQLPGVQERKGSTRTLFAV